MKKCAGFEVYHHAFSTLPLNGDKKSASRPCRFTPTERDHGIQWIGGWEGPQNRFGSSCRESKPGRPASSMTFSDLQKLLHAESPSRWILTSKIWLRIYNASYQAHFRQQNSSAEWTPLGKKGKQAIIWMRCFTPKYLFKNTLYLKE
jgi:hypothetical protein